MVVRSRAPLRISFAGGGTDIAPYYEEKGGVVLSATIDKYVHCTVVPRRDPQLTVALLDAPPGAADPTVEEPWTAAPGGELSLVEAALAHFGARRGLHVYLQTDAPVASGLGLSSAIVVSVLGALAWRSGRRLTAYEAAELAYRVERDELKIRGGKQDQYSAVFGGFNLIEFHRDRTVVSSLRVPPDVLDELGCHLLLCYVGARDPATNNIVNQVSQYIQGKAAVIEALAALKSLAFAMRDALLLGRLTEFGELLDEAWRNKKKLSEGVSNDRIDELYDVAKRNGALGGKILGAGGGGHLLLYCPYAKRQRVANVLAGLGARIIPFGFEERGLRAWLADEPVARAPSDETDRDGGGTWYG